jgi:hypothetical protein
MFGHASGLRTNLSKSSASITYSEEEIQLSENFGLCGQGVSLHLPWPPTLHPKATKEVFLPLSDKVANHLPGWKPSLMNRVGILIMIRAMLTTTPIHMMVALDLPK